MLFLQFQLGGDRYVLDAREVVEVLPPLVVKQLPRAPEAVRGLIDYHGDSVPLLDLSRLAGGAAAPARLSTRIVLVTLAVDGVPRLLGLLAERVTDTLRLPAEAFRDGGIAVPEARYLGPVANTPGGLVQWVRVDALLDAPTRALLYAEAEAA
jgi:chemotaxis-related protein WspB